MDDQIIRDIRHYELKPQGYEGVFDGIFGNVYKSTDEIKFIGQRIARKLNELGLVSGVKDHLYIHLTDKLSNDVIVECDIFSDKRIQSIEYGQNRSDYNDLNDTDKEKKIEELTFKVLKWRFRLEFESLRLVEKVEELLKIEGKALIVNFKVQENSSYKLNVGFQIAPYGNKSKIVVDYLTKKDNSKLRGTIDLNHYEDIYYLVSTISKKDETLVFQPKKSHRAELIARQYLMPLKIEIGNMQQVHN